MAKDPTLHVEPGGTDAGRLRIVYEEGDSEHLKLTEVGPGLYRLEESSLFGDAVYGDTIRVDRSVEGELFYLEIAIRSTLTTQSWMLSPELLATAPVRAVLSAVIDAGGVWEQAFGGLLIVHTPPSIAKEMFDRLTQALSEGGGRSA